MTGTTPCGGKWRFVYERGRNTVDFFKERGIGILQAGSNHGLKYAYFDISRELGMISEIMGGTEISELPEPDDVYPRPGV